MKKYTFKTRHALLMSMISLMTCFAMLFGATFAWFTDSVTSGVNRIVSGNLDVELEYKDNVQTDYTGVTATTELFNSAANGKLWEPGAMAYETFKVSNNGSLALKYQFALNTVDYNTVTRTSGSYDLRDVLKIAVVETTFDATARPDPATLDFKSWSEYANSAAFTGEILPGEDTAQEKTVVIWWPDTNSNDFDNLYNLSNTGWTLDKTNNGKDELYIDLGITLVATQLQNESDSFGPDYDAASTYPSASVEGATFVPTTETVSATVTAGAPTTLTAAVAPAAGAVTSVAFEAGKLTSSSTASLTVETKNVVAASASSFAVTTGNTAVASIDLTLVEITTTGEGASATTTTTQKTGNFGTATITTYIAKGLTGVGVKYNGTGEEPTDVTYEASTGKLTFKTTHFSEYYVTASSEAYIADTNTAYATLPAAVAAVGSKGVITLLRDSSGAGIFVGASDHKDFTVDFAGYTYTCSGPAVGSTGTQNQAWHLEKGNTVTLRNGTVKGDSSVVKMLIQNYCNLTLTDMVLDFVGSGHDYALSNNCGTVVIGGNSKILVDKNKIAFDACVTNNYPDGTKITVKDGTVIAGNIEYGVWGTIPTENKVSLTIEDGTVNGMFVVNSSLSNDVANHISITGGTFSTDVKDYCAKGYTAVPNSVSNPTSWTVLSAADAPAAKAKAAGATSITESSTGVRGTMSDGVVYEWCADGSVYVADATNFAGETYTVPEFVTGLGDSSFKNNKTIKTLKITGNITSAKKALQGNSTITTVDFGSKMTSIPDRMFYRCTGITSLTLPANITRIEDWAFYGNKALQSLTALGQIKYIGYKAFDNCSALKTLDIQGSPAIMGWAGRGASAIETIIIRGENATVNLDYAPAGEAKGSYVFCKEQTGNSGTMNNVKIYVANNTVAGQFASEQSMGATITVGNFPNTAQS